ncbi:MAG TPA: hypothetical protein DEP84_32405 [Chloroflexi bacterium]|nr:hypothetical protein [Chloroflexota bacterium]
MVRDENGGSVAFSARLCYSATAEEEVNTPTAHPILRQAQFRVALLSLRATQTATLPANHPPVVNFLQVETDRLERR